MRQIQREIILQFYSKPLEMSREDNHGLNHINIHIANARPSVHLAPLNSHLLRSTSRKFKSVNLTLNPALSTNKSDLDSEDTRKRHSETIDQNKEHEIYFNRTKKYNYMKEIIDKYFEENKKDKHIIKRFNPESSIHKNLKTLVPKINKTKEEKQEENKNESHDDTLKNRHLLLNKRKNKTTLHKDEEQDLNSSAQISKIMVQKQTENILKKDFSFSSTKAINLPPIDEMFEDKDEELHDFQYESISILSDSVLETVKEDRVLLSDNQIYVVQMATINGKIHHKIKTFKQKGQQILKRQLRAFGLGVESVWIEYRYDPRSLISAPNKSLKELLFKVRRVDTESKFFTLKPKPYYKRLTMNNCEELMRILIQFCSFMKKFQDKILNNKVNTANLFISKNENIRLGQWGFASFKQTHLIQNMEFQNRIEPIVKSQKQWFVPPQYLAPEIIKAIVFGQNIDLMIFGAAPDIWSLGIALLEILTIVPVWIHQKCNIYGKTMQPRQGLLSSSDRDLKKLLKKEQKLTYIVSKLLEQQYADDNFNPKIIQVILKCLQYEPEQRPTYDQIGQILK